jgi:hypothetical protein
MNSPVPAAELPDYFRAREIHFERMPRIDLGFGADKPQYRFMRYALPGPGCAMGIFFEWHTRDFFDSPDGPHLAVAVRGPVEEDPHRGRGLAIGILAGDAPDPANPDGRVPLFDGCPPYPGGPSCFIEDFTINEGTAPIPTWQMTGGRELPALGNQGIYRIDIRVTTQNTRAGVWQVFDDGDYRCLAQVDCRDGGPGSLAGSNAPCPELPEDSGVGNAFIGTGFASPETLSFADNIYLAHWPESD